MQQNKKTTLAGDLSFTLRPWAHRDADDLVTFANNFHIAQFMTDQFPHPYTPHKARVFIEFANSHIPEHILAIEINSRAVGSIGIHQQSDIMRRNAELGYWLGEPYWGRGVITAAVKQMVEYSFRHFDIDRIFARPFGTNIASQRALEKAGFKLEGKFEKTIIKTGEMLDELIYAVRRKG